MPCWNHLKIGKFVGLTQPDRRSGRGRNFRSNPIKKWAMEQGIPVQDPQRPGKEEADWLKHLGAELTLVMAYGHILKDDLLHSTLWLF